MPDVTQVATFGNLERAWQQSVRWARDNFPFFDACRVAELQSRLEQELLSIRAQLLIYKYEFSPYFQLTLPKPDGGVRLISVPDYLDGVVAQAVFNVIKGEFETQITSCAFAYRSRAIDGDPSRIYEPWGKCYSEYVSAIDRFLTLPPESKIIKTDVASFYDNVDQDQLMTKIGKLISGNINLLDLIKRLIKYKVVRPDGTIGDGNGLPIGPAYAHLLANFYLTELDCRWSSKTIAYARYVDDIVMVMTPGTDTNKCLAEFDADLGYLGLKRNIDKTKVSTIGESRDIIDDIKKKKYRIGLLSLQDDGADQATDNLKELFEKAIWDLQEDEISKVNPHLRLILRLYQDSKDRQYLVNLAYEILPQVADPVVCRLAMMLIMQNTDFSVDDRFRETVLSGSYLLQIMFLRAMIEEPNINTPQSLLLELAESKHMLVRILAFSALRCRPIQISSVELRKLVNSQTEQYNNTDSIAAVYAYAARMPNADGEFAQGYLPSLSALAGKGNKTSWLAIIEFIYAQPSSKLLDLFGHETISITRASGYVRLLNSSLVSGNLVFTKSVIKAATEWLGIDQSDMFRIGLRKAYNVAISMGDIGLLIDLASPENWDLGVPYDEVLQTESLLILREAVQAQSNPALAKNAIPLFERLLAQDATSPVSMQGSMPAIKIEGNTYRYDSVILSALDSSVSLIRVLMENGQPAILESVSINTLHQRGFQTIESWKGYLKTQHNNGVTFQTATMEYKNVVHTVYHIPDGFHSIASMREQFDRWAEDSVFEIVDNVGKAVELTRWDQGKFQSVGSSTVFLEIGGSVRFVGLALSCITPIYGSSEKRDYNDTSITAYQQYLSLLIADILFGRLPKVKEKPLEYLGQQARKLSRPFRYIWLRLANQNSDYRYDKWDLASDDIRKAVAIQRACIASPGSTTQLDLSLREVFAYIGFRLSVTRRNPMLRKDSLRDLVYATIEQFLADIQPEQLNPALQELVDPYLNRPECGISKKDRRGLLLICRLLASLADGYDQVYQRDEMLRSVLSRNVALDLLQCIVWLEAESLIKGLVIVNSVRNPLELKSVTQALQSKILAITPADYNRIILIPCTSGLPNMPLPVLISQMELREMLDTLARICDHPSHDANQLNFSTVAQLMFLARLLMDGICIRFPQNEESFRISKSNGVLGYEWAQSFQFLVDSLSKRTTNVEMTSIRSEMVRFLNTCRENHQFQRKHATVLRYNFIRREGKVRFRQGVHLVDKYFDHTAIGSASWERLSDVIIPATVDLGSGENGENYPIRISLVPRQFLWPHPSRQRIMLNRFLSIAFSESGDKYRRGARIITFVLALALIVLGFSLGWWATGFGGFFFLLSVLWKWPESWLFRG